jgi:hypothetical protein
VYVWPAIVTVPVRAAPVFAATDNWTVPSPSPALPLVTATHDGVSDIAVQVQAGPALTITTAEPPPAGTAVDVGAIA